MKILYTAGNRVGAGIQAARIVEHLSKHEVKIAAYVSAYDFLPYIDWCLNAVAHKSLGTKGLMDGINFFGYPLAPSVNIKNAEKFINDISLWAPDLIINDADPIVAHIAKKINIRTWYCSPLFLETGVKWDRLKRKYTTKLIPLKKLLNTLPVAERTFIYSPYKTIMRAEDGYEWITPYYNDLTNYKTKLAVISDKYRKEDLEPKFIKNHISCFTPKKSELIKNAGSYLITGDSNILTDCLYNKKYFCISPQDPEELLNASIAEMYLGLPVFYQSELLETYGVRQLKEVLNQKIKYKFNKGTVKFLHEVIK